jgi:hypothetical protein
MKNLGFTVFAAAVLALPLGAQEVTLRTSIPFEFNVRNATAPAGTYVVRLFAGPLVRLVAGSDSYSLLADPDTPNTGSHEAKLVFHRYGNQYFLSQISTGPTSRDVPVSRVEGELQKTARSAQTVIVVAMR